MTAPFPRPLSYAILADGGFVHRRLGSASAPMSVEGFRDLVDKIRALPELENHRLLRVYYYDAPPLGPNVRGGSSFHEQLSELPFVSLRMGELRSRRNRREVRGKLPAPVDGKIVVKAKQLVPAVHQKGVDMRLGLDIASLSLKKQADIIVLVTRDADFVPAMKFARREGAQVYLVPLGDEVRRTMREHADLVLAVELE